MECVVITGTGCEAIAKTAARIAKYAIEFEEALDRVNVVIVEFASAATDALKHINDAMAQSYALPSFVEDIKSLEEMMNQLADECDDIIITPEQKTKASYKRNLELQNRRYKIQTKIACCQVNRRKFFVRKLP